MKLLIYLSSTWFDSISVIQLSQKRRFPKILVEYSRELLISAIYDEYYELCFLDISS